jgi:hypothetical protein
MFTKILFSLSILALVLLVLNWTTTKNRKINLVLYCFNVLLFIVSVLNLILLLTQNFAM